MKSCSTSTDYSNICMFAASGRVGSNFLLNSIRSDRSYFCMGEFFNSVDWNLSINSNIIQLMCHEKSEHIFEFADWLTKLHKFLRKNLKNISSPNFCDVRMEMREFNGTPTIKLYDSIVDFLNNKLHKNTVHKIFFSNTTIFEKHSYRDLRNNFIDIEELLKKCNSLIIPYRKNALLTYISDKKSYENNIYYIDSRGVNSEKIKESQDFKISWDKKEYLHTFDYLNNSNKTIFEIYKNFIGNKCIVNFEELHKQEDKVFYLQNTLQQNNINVNINPEIFNPTVRQSKDQSYENNFTNREEFLKDLADIPVFLEYEY